MLRKYFVNVNGILAIIFGLIAIIFPGITLAALGVYFAITILIGGITMIVGAARLKATNSRWYNLLPEGIIGLLLGILILARPELVATVFVAIIGIWALVMGLIFIFTFYRSRNMGFTNIFMLLIGILSVIMGGIIVFNPFESTRMITVIIGVYALIYGLFSVINSSRFYRHR